MIQIETKLNEKDVKYIFKKPLCIMLAMTAIGALGLVLYIVLGTILETTNLDFLLVFAIPFAVGIVFYFWFKNQMKRALCNPPTFLYKFDDTSFSVKFLQNGIETEQKFEYSIIKKVKETTEYLFLFVSSNVSYIIKKTDTSIDNIKKIKSLVLHD